MNVDMDSIVINIESTTQKATNAIDTLISKLNNLQQALSSVGKSSSNFQKIGKSISKTPKISTPKSNGSNLQTQLDALKVNLNDYDVSSVFKSQNTKGITSEITRYKNELGNVVTVEKKMKDGMEDYYRVTQRVTKDSVTTWEKFKNSIAGSVAKITAFYAIARNLSTSLVELTETSAEYTEAVNLFYTEMGDKAREAEKWVKKFSDALYLDPSDVMQYMGSFNSLVSGLGVGANNSYIMSKNLTQLAYDLASYKNISFEQAFDKLSSGIAGQIKGLRQVGVALSQNTLQELANELGIQQRVTTMDEASKAQLRYIQIMRSSTNWQGDLGKTMMSTENILKSARQQWTLLTRALGDVAAVIIRQVMPYFIALTQLIKEAAISLAKFFGLDIDFADAFKTSGGSISTDLGGIEDGIEDIGGAARKAKKDINTMLAPFDDLNVVQTELEKTGSGVGGAAGGVGLGDLPLPEYDALAKLTSEWSDKIEEAKKKLKSMITVAKVLATAMATVWAINKIATFISSLKTIKGSFDLLKKALEKTSFGAFMKGIKPTISLFTKLAGVIVGVITVIKGGKGLYETMKKLGSGAKMCGAAFALLVGDTLELTAGAALAGLAIGGPLGAAIGALTGLVISGVTAFAGYNKGLNELAKSKVFGDINISTEQFSKALNNLKFSFSNVQGVITNYRTSMKDLGDTFGKTSESVDLYLAKFQYLGESINGEVGESFKASLESLFSTANEIIATGTQYSLDLWTTTFAGMTTITATEQANILKVIQDNGKYVSEEMATAQNTINSIWDNAISTRGYLTQEEYNTIQEMLNKIRELTGSEMTKTQADVEYYKKLFGDKNYKLDEESYANYKKAREKYEKEQRNIIKDNYETAYVDLDTQLKTLQKRRETANSDERKELDKQIKEIKKSQDKLYKDRTNQEKELEKELKKTDENIVSNLKEQYAKLTDETNKTAKKQKKIIEGIFKDLNIDTKELQNSMRTAGGMCAKTFAEEFNRKRLKLNVSPNSKIGFDGASLSFTAQTYATGGYPDKASLFWANENGIPEMVGRIGNQTAVANNDQITTALTNALISALSGMNFGGQGTTVVNIGNKKVYEGMGEYINNESERYGTTYITV